ncbi:hypothetical protein PFISCL1PPCAC_13607, partial [Pristionchus fissidentatus]
RMEPLCFDNSTCFGIALFSESIRYNLPTMLNVIITVLTITQFIFLAFLLPSLLLTFHIIRKSSVFHPN